MHRRTRRTWLAIGTVPLVGVVGLTTTSSLTPTTAGAVATMPSAVGPTSKVIVLLRDKVSGLAATSPVRARTLQSEESPFVDMLRLAGAKDVTAATSLPFVIASVTAAQRKALRTNPLVQAVEPDSAIPYPVPARPAADLTGATSSTAANLGAAGRSSRHGAPAAPTICGTALAPESDPEAINVIHAPDAATLGYDGAGVTVAYIADGVNPANPDFTRNAAYASSGSSAGSPVLTQKNFTGDPAGTATGGAEAFLDSSSIAAQGNTAYDLNNYVYNGSNLTTPCDIKITGSAPGANVLGLDVFSGAHDTTESNFLQAIDYAVGHGAKVLNESFGSNNFPDTALDATRIADDDAVAARVTVVVSSGDAGVTSTLGSPATDPRLISVGASTTFRSYEQDTYGGINASVPNATNGSWIDSNISSLSSGGFSQAGGNTVDLVAPGDLNWALCDVNTTLYTECTNSKSPPTGSPITLSGGTSESSPLTAGAAADVIQAYASTHGGTDPSPALVKQILVSTATDTGAPADQQGAGLLNVLAAVREAASMPGTSGTRQGGLLLSPTQINVVQAPGASAKRTISVTNTGNSSDSVTLSTRALTDQLATHTGSFCLNPSSSAISCGAPTANTFQIWSGATEVYQEQTFQVPSAAHVSRLDFSATYPYTGQASLLHVALIDPTGSYAGYSLPQGLADYANIQISKPAAGTWTAVFFTLKDGGSGNGTRGTIHWRATTSQFENAGTILPASLTLPAGATKTATFTATSPAASGDTAQSIVLTASGVTNTIPVTVRTTVPIGPKGGTFKGVLTGGNGRGNPAATNTYMFKVPSGKHDIDVSASFADKNDGVVALLLDPEGQAVAASSSVTLNSAGNALLTTGHVNLYKDAPQAGEWSLVLDWLQPVSGTELAEPFNGAVRFNQVSVSSTIPAARSVGLRRGKSYTYKVTVKNTGLSPESFFVDPRGSKMATVRLVDQNGPDQNMTLPLPPGVTFPVYLVPNDTKEIMTKLSGTAPVTYDTEPFLGDPDLSPALAAPGVTRSNTGHTASLNFTTPGGIAPGPWYLNPSEIGPYGAGGAATVTANASFKVLTRQFASGMTSSTGDLWRVATGLSNPSSFTPKYVQPGKTVTISITIKPTAAVGTRVSGSVNLDDVFLLNVLVGVPDTSGDELASLPFSYTVCPQVGTCSP